ncbi:MAG: MmcB family DNA repair protein, partial [Rhodospirillaceae bacterium]
MDVDPPTEPPGRTLARGVCRLLEAEGWAVLTELTLANGRRVDVAAVDKKARFLVVEVKSSVADFTSDHKWQDYLGFADLFAFAVP